MKKFQLSVIGLAMASMGFAAAAQQSTDVGKVTVTGEGDKLGAGLLIDEDTPKAKSTVTKASIEKQRSSSNPYQNLALLPGVNASSFDATGMFGGNLRVRGFNSDQMGFTINGAPVNDSGSFSVFPQEYSDSENLCEIFITQGATDTEAPHVGASGGNVGLSTCAPNDKAGGKFSMSAGQLGFGRVFVRGDTGLIGNFKAFLSASKGQVKKWKGEGKADRDHIDAAVEYSIGNVKLSGSLLWNKAFTNNFRALTLAQFASEGYFADFATALPQHAAPSPGTAKADTAPSVVYYGYSVNPFENYLVTTKANIQITPAVRLDIEPYFWYGYGTGGNQQTTVTEGLSPNKLHGGIPDLNGDGDALDTVLIYRSSVTRTYRPGATVKLSWTLDNQRILGGFWVERARHRQTGPGSIFDNNGNVANPWLGTDSSLITYADGTLLQGRNVLTISTGESAFVSDTIDLLNSKLQVIPGLSYRRITRDFTNYGAGVGNTTLTAPANGRTEADYVLNNSYSKVLPSLALSYQVVPALQAFASLSKNFKVPGNFDYFGLGNGVTVTNGVGTATSLAAVTVQPENSTNLDFGLRYKTDLFKASATAFLVKFKDRIATAYDPATSGSHDYNVGDSTIKGLEVELGTAVWKGFSAYASATYTRSTIDKDLPVGTSAGVFLGYLPTSGVQFADTPKGMAALSLQYAEGPFLLNVSGKYTGPRNVTLIGDQSLPGFTTVDVNAAFQLPAGDVFKKSTIRLNISNLANTQYKLANSGSGSSISSNGNAVVFPAGTLPANAPSVYGGAPRFTSVTFTTEF